MTEDTAFTDELAGLMQESIATETGNAGLLDLEDLTLKFKHEVDVLFDYQQKLAEYRVSVEGAVKLVEKRIKAIQSAIDVLTASEPYELAVAESSANKSVRAVKRKAA